MIIDNKKLGLKCLNVYHIVILNTGDNMTLTTQNDFSIQLNELDKIAETCKKLMQTRHYAQIGEAGICAIMARAKALGIHPFEALNGGFHCINGKVGMSTEMMAALVRQKGHSITKDPKSNSETCILKGKRADNGDEWTCTFSKADAEAAGLWNSATWKKYPAVMLYNRCMSMLFRQLFPDLSLGAGYVEDELKEITKTGDYANSLPVSESEVIIPKIEELPPQFPSVTDIKLLKLVLEKCPFEVTQKLNDWMLDKNYMSYADIPANEFKGILENAHKHKKAEKEAE